VNVVIRGIQASGMAVYAAIHLWQAVSPPEQAPGWLTAAFVLTALVAIALAGALMFVGQREERPFERCCRPGARIGGGAGPVLHRRLRGRGHPLRPLGRQATAAAAARPATRPE